MKMDLLKYSYQEKEQGACWSLKVFVWEGGSAVSCNRQHGRGKKRGAFETVTEIIVNEKNKCKTG